MEKNSKNYRLKNIVLAILALFTFFVSFEFFWIGNNLLNTQSTKNNTEQNLEGKDISPSLGISIGPKKVSAIIVQNGESIAKAIGNITGSIKSTLQKNSVSGPIPSTSKREAASLEQQVQKLGEGDYNIYTSKKGEQIAVINNSEISQNLLKKLEEQSYLLPPTDSSEIPSIKKAAMDALPEVKANLGENQALDGSLSRAYWAQAEKITVRDTSTNEIIREIPVTDEMRKTLDESVHKIGNINRTNLNTLDQETDAARMASFGKADPVDLPDDTKQALFRADRVDKAYYNDTSAMSETWKPKEYYEVSLPDGETIKTVSLPDSAVNRDLYTALTELPEGQSMGNKIAKISTNFFNDREGAKILGYESEQISALRNDRFQDYINANGTSRIQEILDTGVFNKEKNYKFFPDLRENLSNLRNNSEIFKESNALKEEVSDKLTQAQIASYLGLNELLDPSQSQPQSISRDGKNFTFDPESGRVTQTNENGQTKEIYSEWGEKGADYTDESAKSFSGVQTQNLPTQLGSAQADSSFTPGDVHGSAIFEGNSSMSDTNKPLDPYTAEMNQLTKEASMVNNAPTISNSLDYLAKDPLTAGETIAQTGVGILTGGGSLLTKAGAKALGAGILASEATSGAFKKIKQSFEDSPEVKAEKATEELKRYEETGEWGTFYDRNIRSLWNKDAEMEWVGNKTADKYEIERKALEQSQAEQRKVLGLPEGGDPDFNRAILEDQKNQRLELLKEQLEKDAKEFSVADPHGGAYTPAQDLQESTNVLEDKRSLMEKILPSGWGGKTVEEKNNELAAEQRQRTEKIQKEEESQKLTLESSASETESGKTLYGEAPSTMTASVQITDDSQPIGSVGPGGETAMPSPPDTRRKRNLETEEPSNEKIEPPTEISKPEKPLTSDNYNYETGKIIGSNGNDIIGQPPSNVTIKEEDISEPTEKTTYVVGPDGKIINEETGKEYNNSNKGTTANNSTGDVSSDMEQIGTIQATPSKYPDQEPSDKEVFGKEGEGVPGSIPTPNELAGGSPRHENPFENIKDIETIKNTNSDFTTMSEGAGDEKNPKIQSPKQSSESTVNQGDQDSPTLTTNSYENPTSSLSDDFANPPVSAEQAEQSAQRVSNVANAGDYLATMQDHRQSIFNNLYGDNSTVVQEALNRFAADNKINPLDGQKLDKDETDFVDRQAEFLKNENLYWRDYLKNLDQEIVVQRQKYEEGLESLSDQEMDSLQEMRYLSDTKTPNEKPGFFESFAESIKENAINDLSGFVKNSSKNPTEIGKVVGEHLQSMFSEYNKPDKEETPTEKVEEPIDTNTPQQTTEEPPQGEPRSFSLNNEGKLVDKDGNEYKGAGSTTANNTQSTTTDADPIEKIDSNPLKEIPGIEEDLESMKPNEWETINQEIEKSEQTKSYQKDWEEINKDIEKNEINNSQPQNKPDEYNPDEWPTENEEVSPFNSIENLSPVSQKNYQDEWEGINQEIEKNEQNKSQQNDWQGINNEINNSQPQNKPDEYNPDEWANLVEKENETGQKNGNYFDNGGSTDFFPDPRGSDYTTSSSPGIDKGYLNNGENTLPPMPEWIKNLSPEEQLDWKENYLKKTPEEIQKMKEKINKNNNSGDLPGATPEKEKDIENSNDNSDNENQNDNSDEEEENEEEDNDNRN